MAYTAKRTAGNAERDHYNAPGYCLQVCRTWAGISARYPTAASAWIHNTHKHRNRNPPRGAAVYWLGGSRGYGHIAISLGHGRIRSTDAGGSGRVATVPLGWIERNWGQRYVGWSYEINGQV